MAHPGSYRWTDVLPTFVSSGKGNTSLTTQVAPDAASLSEYEHFRSNADARLSLRFQFPHSWKLRSQVRPHLHLMPCTNEAGSPEDVIGNVVFNFYFAWTDLPSGQPLPNFALWTHVKVVTPITVADQYTEIIVSPGLHYPPVWAGVSANMHCVMQRPGSSDGDDTYEAANPVGLATANIAVVSADCHALVQQTGSQIELAV